MNLHFTPLCRAYRSFAWLHIALLFVLLAGIVASGSVWAQTASPELNRAYFIRQAPDEALLIRITAYEGDLNSRIYAAERRLLLSSSTNGNRIAPLFQFIESSGQDRQLDIEVTSQQFTSNTQFEIGITRLKVWDNRSQTLAKAYALMSFGMQSTQSTTAASWTVKINSLLSAADTFAQFGMTELKHWSTWLATNLIQTQLHDYNMVLGMIPELQNATRASQWQDISLATQQTRAAAIMGLVDSGRGQGTSLKTDDVQTALTAVAEMAGRMGYRFARSQALYESGLQFTNQADDARSLQQFQQALDIADEIGDAGLSKSIRESMAGIHEEQGDDPATGDLLRQLESQLAKGGQGGDELALNLLQQGRILMRTWQYSKAQEILQQALEFENDSSIGSQINLELAQVAHETGQTEASSRYLAAAGIRRNEVGRYFDKLVNSAGFDTSGFRRQAEADFQKASSLAKQGNKHEAQQALDALLDEVLFLRQALPGVLGSWYWQRQDALIDEYLALNVADESDNLLALSKIRLASKPSRMKGLQDDLRASLAQSEGQGASRNRPQLKKLRDQFMTQFSFLTSQGVRSWLNSLPANSVLLTYHLSPQNASVWVADRNAVTRRSLANASELHKQLASNLDQLASANRPQFNALMKEMNDLLIAPVSDLLQSTVYVVPAGLTLSLPFDSLRSGNRYWVEDHAAVIKVMSFPSVKPLGNTAFGPPKQVFLAGDPQDFQAEYANRLQQSAQIRAVTDQFVGPGLNIVQGTALLPDEFQSESYQQSELIHLAMPGLILLDQPDLSSLQLSEPLRDLGRINLRPISIRYSPITATLVYLADTRVQGLAGSASSQQIGLVSDFLQSGANAVIAQIMPLPEAESLAFLGQFYTELRASGDISSAFTRTKRAAIKSADPADKNAWSALQLFTN